MAFDGYLPALAAVGYALLLLAAVFIYLSLVRQIRARVIDPAAVPIRDFGWFEAILAALLACWFLLNIAVSLSVPHDMTSIRSRDLAWNAVLTIGLLLFIATCLRLRGLNLSSLGGFTKIGFGRAVATGAILMLSAYPLVLLASALTQSFLRGVPEKQGIVELFNASSTLERRILIILLAVTIAPIAEEFFFRFFLYGVMRRYFGYGVALLINALLFAALHVHLPSLAPLFVLGICFTIAYEWTGSILVPMTMHAIFNAVALTALAFPEIVPQ